MPLSCDCYGGCWAEHSKGWPRVTLPDPARLDALYRDCWETLKIPHGSYVLVASELELRLETEEYREMVERLLASTAPAAGERCQRCGEVGEDRRTLWMACFYAMGELDVPFTERVLFHAQPEDLTAARDAVQVDLGVAPTAQRITVAPGTVRCSGELTPQGMFTLRVCKDCRGAWLRAIERWFAERAPRRESPGSGIFVRENGATVEITREEWDRREASRKPEETG